VTAENALNACCGHLLTTIGLASLYPERASQINAMPAPPGRPWRSITLPGPPANPGTEFCAVVAGTSSTRTMKAPTISAPMPVSLINLTPARRPRPP